MTDPGPDGYGPPPSKEAIKAAAPFFSDSDPPSGTAEQRAAIEANIKKRRPPWRK
jgi:hypothetical protein